jgi:hypothetical protein
VSFEPKLHKNIRIPHSDFPSLHYLNPQELIFEEIYIHKVCFLKALVKIPQCKEDTSGALFEEWIYKLASAKNKELYADYPR